MTAIRLIVPGADYSALGLGNFKTPLKVTPDALYALGSALVAGSSYAVGQDLAGNYGALVATGAPTVNANDSQVSQAAYYTAPFTGDALAAPNSAFTIIGLSKCAQANNHSLVSTSSEDFTSRDFALRLDSAHEATTEQYTPGRSQGFATDANRGTRYELFSARASTTLIRIGKQYSGGAFTSPAGSAFAAQAIGGARQFRIGASYGASYTGAANTALVGFWSRSLTDVELQQVYSDLQAWLNPLGLAL